MKYFYILLGLIRLSICDVCAQVIVSNSIPSLTIGEGNCDVALGVISLKETVKGDFGNGTNQRYYFDLPSGFEFSSTDASTVTINYTGSTYLFLSKSFSSTTRFILSYSIASTDNDVGMITISGLKVKCIEAGKWGEILRKGGDADQAGNDVSDKQSHGYLDSRTPINCTTYIPEETELEPITAPHVSCAGGYLYFTTKQYPSATYKLKEGNTTRVEQGSSNDDPVYLSGILPNANSGLTFFHVETTLSNGCVLRSEDIDFDFLTTPSALIDHSYHAPLKDTIFPKSAPVLELNSYLSLNTGDELVNFYGAGVYNTDGNSYVFDPGSVITGKIPIYYSLTNGTCAKSYSLGHKFTVYDPLEPPPSYISVTDEAGAPKTFPFCKNGGNLKVTFHPPAGTMLTHVYLARASGTSVDVNVSLPVDATAGAYLIRPTIDDYNGRIHTYISYKNSFDNIEHYNSGYITIFPKRQPQLLGLPTHVNDTIMLCTVGKDSIIMHANPVGGIYKIEKFKSNIYTPLIGADLSAFAIKPLNAPDNSYKAFVPEILFNTIGEANDQIKFKITYIYPPIGLSFCPDTVIKYFRFARPIDVNYSVLSPTALPYCDRDILNFKINNSNPGDKFYWNFGDGISKEADSLLYSSYLYAKPGKYLLRFKSLVKSLSIGSCNNDILDTIRIGAKPIADFVVQNHYENKQAEFSSLAVLHMKNTMKDNGVVDKINSWSWQFGDGVESIAETDSLSHNTYAHYKAKPYRVTHIVQAEWGCSDTMQREIPVFPLIDFSSGNYEEDYNTNDSTGFYQSGDYKTGGNSSWKYQVPATDNKTILSSSPAWITENGLPDTSYNANEFSWVESPAFKLDQLQLPMIALDTWCLAEKQVDGACLQWAFADTTFGNEKWHTIGLSDQGLNWYNSNLLAGMLYKVEKNGIHTPGWTDSTGNKWQRSKFNLDKLKATAGNRAVRFRLLFVSNNENAPGQYDGFAFDNFFVGERNRKVLIEEFCDYLNYEQKFNETAFAGNKQFIRMQYHNRYMNLDDEINNQNKGEAGARNLLYGYSQLPRAAVDGYYSLDYAKGFFGNNTALGFGERNADKRLLELSPFSIAINMPSLSGNSLRFTVDIKRNDFIQTQGPFVIQVAVLEKQVTGNGITFSNVFRKFLPDAAGEHVDKDKWILGDTKTLQRNFTPFVPLSNVGDGDTSLILVAFVQDEATSEIYQTESISLLYGDVKALSHVPLPTKINLDDLAISLYPNPVQNNLSIRFENRKAQEDYQYRLVDGFGKTLMNGSIAKDAGEATITGLQDFPVGLYQLQLVSDTKAITRSFSIVR